MIKAVLITLVLFAASGVLWVTNCSGPEPKVADVRLEEPEEEGEPYRLEAVVVNEGPGHGQVGVNFRLLNKATGETIVEDKQATLERNERTRVSAEFQAPKAEYEPRVEVEYPVR